MATPAKEQKLILAAVGAGLLAGYSLFAILFFMGWALAELLIAASAQSASVPIYNKAKAIIVRLFGRLSKNMGGMLVLSVVVAAVIPIVELIAGYNYFEPDIVWLTQAKQLVGNFFGYYLASGPRPHDIGAGNIIFNQVPGYAFVPTLFTQSLWWIFAFMVGFYALVINGLRCMVKNKTAVHRWIVIMGVGIALSYCVVIYGFVGSHIISRRLDGAAALFLLIFCCYGLYDLIAKIKNSAFVQGARWLQLGMHTVGLLIFSVAITASYSLGPDTNTVSVGQYQAAQYIWSLEKNSATKCVLADTLPLLAVEAVSGKEIIGGNFPIDANFGQPERVLFFEHSRTAIDNNLLRETAALTGADHCWFMGSVEDFGQQGLLTGQGTKMFGDTAVVRYNTNQ